VRLAGNVGQIERAFHTELEAVRMPGGRLAYLNADPPAVPATIAPYVQGVIGLQDTYVEQPQQLVRFRRPGRVHSALRPHAIGVGPAPCLSAQNAASADVEYGPGSGYTADQISSMYGLGNYYQSGDQGAGQTVALFEEQPYQPTDISTYQACYGLPTTAPTNVNVDGGPGAYAPTQDDGEAALDIEQIIGLAPKANILVYQGPATATSPGDILSQIVSDNKAKVISSSWGLCEALTQQSVINEENTVLQEAATQGQSFFISSGDSGSEMCYQATRDTSSPNESLSVIDPGGQPFATAVGGTSLGETINNNTNWEDPQNGTYPGEFVWNDEFGDSTIGPPNQASGTGGGVSDQWPMPSYQSSAAGSLDVIQSNSSRNCGNQFCREVPDVSADADVYSGYVIYSNGGGSPSDGAVPGWGVTGGTSAAAPLWAAFTALANASSACRGFTLGFENPALYQIAGSQYLANFHDITGTSPFFGEGSNDTWAKEDPSNPNGLYPVLTGYDMATGLGSPIANVLGNSLCSARAPVYNVSVTNPGSQSSVTGKAVSLQIAGNDSGSNTTLTYSATGLPAGLSMSSGGLITGTPTTAGTGTVTVNVSDQFTNAGSTQFVWTVVTPGPPTASLGGVAGLKSGKAKLAFSFAAGSNAPAIASVQLVLPKGLSFVHKAKLLRKGISVTSGAAKVPFTITGGGATLVLHLAAAQPTIAVRLGSSALSESAALQKRAHKRKAATIQVTIVVTDAAGHPTSLAEPIKV
jgi:kumamolisin